MSDWPCPDPVSDRSCCEMFLYALCFVNNDHFTRCAQSADTALSQNTAVSCADHALQIQWCAMCATPHAAYIVAAHRPPQDWRALYSISERLSVSRAISLRSLSSTSFVS